MKNSNSDLDSFVLTSVLRSTVSNASLLRVVKSLADICDERAAAATDSVTRSVWRQYGARFKLMWCADTIEH